MRVFFTGAQGTGKSTLVRKVNSEFVTLKMFDSMSRVFMRKKEDQKTDDFQKQISLYCLNLYVNEDDFVSSRSYFDSIAYPQYGGYKNILDMVSIYEDMLFEDDCIYFYAPIEFKISSGGNELRLTDEKYQEDIDLLIRKEIEIQKEKGHLVEGENFFVLTGDVEQRMSIIREVLRSKGLKTL